ncbi:hypothetical protein [Xenorhabdus sp. TH1]|uniref:hypothetical protein n=1 Tax=Xenorhabdus sp. TH1 TaxID=3130166 RepID=UPI0030CC0446
MMFARFKSHFAPQSATLQKSSGQKPEAMCDRRAISSRNRRMNCWPPRCIVSTCNNYGKTVPYQKGSG